MAPVFHASWELKGGLQFSADEAKMLPVKYLPNMEVISIETLMGANKDTATIWRGPLEIRRHQTIYFRYRVDGIGLFNH